MKSETVGKATSKVEIQNISPHGIWMFLEGREYFLDYGHYPWFRKATVEQICDVQRIHDFHLYWEALDVDLDVDSLDEPENYPLVAR